MKRLDLTGQRFGNLVVIEQDLPHIKPSGVKISTWKCQCDCGKITTVRTEYLRSGHTKSCGCEAGREDIQGKKFGRLLTIERIKGGKWRCQCECGNIVEVQTYNLKNGNTQSCGCLQKERTSQTSLIDLTGLRFGKLIVIERVENNRFNHVCYKCLCDCGGQTIVDAANLRNGNTNSCGCIKSKGEMKINQWLVQAAINFQSQYSHNDIVLSSGRRPFFDFAIFNEDGSIKCFIEYQGQQHYQITGGWNNEEHHTEILRRDEERRDECKRLNIPLYEIPYWTNIEEELEKIFN